MKQCSNCNEMGMVKYTLIDTEEGISSLMVPNIIWVCQDPHCFVAYTEEQYAALKEGPSNPHPLEEKT